MSDMSKISIQVREFEFEYEGSQIEVDEKFAQFKDCLLYTSDAADE